MSETCLEILRNLKSVYSVLGTFELRSYVPMVVRKIQEPYVLQHKGIPYQITYG